MFGEIFQNVVPKPAKASGTQWIAHKVNSMERVLSNYSSFRIFNPNRFASMQM